MADYNPPPKALPPGSIVWAYLRDSGGTGQEQSVGDQRNELEAYCTEHGLLLARVYEDVAKSATTTKGRNQFNAMFAAALTDEIHPQGILVWSLSRLARNMNDSMRFKSTLRAAGIKVHSLTEQIPDGDEGILFEAFHDYQHAGFSKQQSHSIKRGQEGLLRSGYSFGGFPPRGYVAEKYEIGKHRDGRPRLVSKWVPDPEIFPLVQLAWRLRAEGKPYAEITKATGGKVYQSVNCWATFFRNRTYLGIAKYGADEYPDHHPAAVDLETFNKVQAICSDGKRRLKGLSHPRRVRFPSLLAGLAFCKTCGASMIHHTGGKTKKTPYYVCGTRDRRHGVASCPERRVSGPPAENAILDAVLSRVLTPAFVDDLLEEIRLSFSDTEKLTEEIKRKRTTLHETRRAIQNLLELAENFGSRSAADKLKQRETEEALLAAEIKSLEERKSTSDIEITPEALGIALDAWREELKKAQETNDVSSMRSFLARFVQRIDLGYHEAVIWYNYPVISKTPIVKTLFEGTLP